jgi:hypothetical protein
MTIERLRIVTFLPHFNQMQKVIFLFLLAIAFPGKGFSQIPTVYKRYTNSGEFPVGGQLLTLASNGIFYFSMSAESRAIVAKGSWKIKKDKLYLTAWSRQKSYPTLKIEFVNQPDTGKVVISATDAFHQPFNFLGVALIRKNSKGDYPALAYLDSTGKLIVDKNEYPSFYLLYQYGDSEAEEFDKNVKVYSFGQDIQQVKMHIDFDAGAPLDRGVVVIDYGNHVFNIKKDGLYEKGKRVFNIEELK